MVESTIAAHALVIFLGAALLFAITGWLFGRRKRAPAKRTGDSDGVQTVRGSQWRRVLSLAKLGSELIGKFPKSGDSFLEKVAKILAMLDATDKVYGGRSRAYEDIFTRYKLQARTSEPFVRLFFGTKMAKGFKMSRVGVSEHVELIEAETPDGERIFFQERTWGGRPEIDSEFFFSPAFDFKAALDALWSGYPHGLYLSVKPTRGGWGSDVTFTPEGKPRGELVSRKGRARVEAAVDDWKSRRGEPWCFVAYGPPGTGKTGHVKQLAAALDARLLVLDATSLPHLGEQEVAFLFDALAPGVLLIDDFDEAPVEAARARMRHLFQHLHEAHAGITIAITVNDPKKVDVPLLRSERIDCARFFGLPDAEERRDIIAQLVAVHCPGKLDDLTETVAATDGFNHSDLGGLVKRFRTGTVPAAFADMKELRDLAAAAEGAKDEKKGPDTPPASK